jgi:hypothetical protein
VLGSQISREQAHARGTQLPLGVVFTAMKGGATPTGEDIELARLIY